jgi:hypothetical protein
MNTKVRFFNLKLSQEEAVKLGGHFEIQLLDSRGRASAVVYANSPIEKVVIENKEYSGVILKKGGEISEGKGLYVDESGNEISPF